MKNINAFTQRIIAKQPRLTTVDGPQIIFFRKIKHKCWSKTAAQAHIQILSPPVDEGLVENEKIKKYLRGLCKNSFKKLRQEKEIR